MKACASLPAITNVFSTSSDMPMVLINDVPQPQLIPQDIRIAGPLDRRSSLIRLSMDNNRRDFNDQYTGKMAILALANRLVDEQVRWAVLVRGQIDNDALHLTGGSDNGLLELTDNWNHVLDATVSKGWWETEEGLLFDDRRPVSIGVGPAANRSRKAWPIGGELIYVFQDQGQPWTVATALRTLSALNRLKLSFRWVPTEIQNLPLLKQIRLDKSVGEVLKDILEPYGLIIQRELIRESGTVIERRSIRPIAHERTIRLAWPDERRPLGQVLQVKSDRSVEASQHWLARANGWRIESTFELSKGWDPALEGEPDEAYSKLHSSDFVTYADVYRLWALNEDGQYSGPPYLQGPPFDLANFFEDPSIWPQPLRFLPTLIKDSAGVTKPPIVEMSTDGGTSWLVYPGPIQFSTDRAAIYLNDTTLPTLFLTSAKLGDAKIRVTASLQSPVLVQVERWSGNPFKGIKPDNIFHFRNSVRFQRVAPTSLHYNDIIQGNLTADEVDQTNDLHRWLVIQIQLSKIAADHNTGQAQLTLAGPWPFLRIGDRLVNTIGPGINAAQQPEAVISKGATIRSLCCRWSNGDTIDHRSPSGRRAFSPLTTIELMF